jgi:hypothetical protein
MSALRRLRPSLGNGRPPDFHCKSVAIAPLAPYAPKAKIASERVDRHSGQQRWNSRRGGRCGGNPVQRVSTGDGDEFLRRSSLHQGCGSEHARAAQGNHSQHHFARGSDREGFACTPCRVEMGPRGIKRVPRPGNACVRRSRGDRRTRRHCHADSDKKGIRFQRVVPIPMPGGSRPSSPQGSPIRPRRRLSAT